MKITGWKTLTTQHNWQRPIGDVNGIIESGITEVPVLILETDSGYCGIGVGGHTDIERIFPAIEGEDPRAVNALYDRMQSWVFKSSHQGNTFGAIGVIDMALWDLKAKIAGEPLWRLLGARSPFIPGYASGLDYPLNMEELLALHQRFVDRGFSAVKIKAGLDIETDIERILAVRELYLKNSSSPVIMIDVNESMNVKHAIRYVKQLGKHIDLAWIEEPVRRWDANGHSMIRKQISAAVATGENLTGLEQFLPLLQENAVDVLQTGMCWGISHFLRVANLAHAWGLPISPVSYNCNPVAHAAAAIPNHLTCEVQDLNFPIGLTVDQKINDGGILLGEKPGLGIEVDEAEILRHQQQAQWTIPQGPHVRPEQAGLHLSLSSTTNPNLSLRRKSQ
ncbi:mandelate racemase/muconate lactonizing enzyme family protein [Providencia rettgeri]|nr:mandelate racemase/muconate lactonizing enzyme family protein [Providencia rettgeri]EJD6584258.1 mandelate racemase/muconate lactonizing enzyme family protein [Providencia rettgeri]ELR5238813.1 mandelate racemase/muconate lactonizing enzyme family protein [Providencia rettgeri]